MLFPSLADPIPRIDARVLKSRPDNADTVLVHALLRNWKPVAGGTRPLVLLALLTFSALSTLFGMKIMLGFDQTAGAVAPSPSTWPVGGNISRAKNTPQLLVFVHPECSCSIATLDELARVTPQAKIFPHRLVTDILFYRTEGLRSGEGKNQSESSRLWNIAKSLPGARVRWDDGGRETQRFGAQTSGFALLYGAQGQLLFHGGVTGSRGHEGDNAGLDRLVTALYSGRPASSPSLVFGCALGSFADGRP